MSGDVVTWGAVVAAIGVLVTVIGFWTRYSDRVTKAEGMARQAADAAAEARREAKEAGERANAAAEKLYQMEIWARDEFVRKSSFEAVVARLERGFTELKTDIGGRLDRMTDRIETIKAGAPQH